MLNKKIYLFGLLKSSLLLLFLFNSSAFADYELKVSDEDNVMKYINSSYGEQFSSAMIYGDFNGDGALDLAVSAPYASSDLMEWNGKISIFFGGKDYSKEPAVNIYGANSGDQAGISLSAGDLNGDGTDDLIIGSHNASFADGRFGKVSIVYGKREWSQSIVELKASAGIYELYGTEKDSHFGIVTKVSDINNDGVLDILVGSPNEFTGKEDYNGRVHLFKGPIGKKSQPDYSFDGFSKNGKFGSNIAVSNLDGKKQVFISAYRESINEKTENGALYSFVEHDLYPNVWEKNEKIWSGEKNYEWFAFQILNSDLNGDDVEDLIVSSFPFASSERVGKVSVYISKTEEDAENKDKPDYVFEKKLSDIILGSSLGVIDYAGKKRIVIGAPGVGYPKGESSGTVEINALDNEKITIIGENADDWFGYRVLVFDFNNDGFDDIVVGAKYADGENGVNNGAFYMFWGSADFLDKGPSKPLIPDQNKKDNTLKRGEAVSILVEAFNLKNDKFVANCMEYREFCLFDFLARTNFSDVKIDPELILYPDNLPGSENYEEINIVTMLGIVNGFMEMQNSPFKPEIEMTRIQALKIVLGASDLVDFMYKFELEGILGQIGGILLQKSQFQDINAVVSHMWWYPRYVNFAFEADIVGKTDNFRPDELITLSEYLDMINRTKEYLTKINAGTQIVP